MAKHFIKLEEGHWAWLTDEEYKKHRRGGCLTTIIAILIWVGIAKDGNGESKEKNKSEFKTEQVSKKENNNQKKDIISANIATEQDTCEENAATESEQTSTSTFRLESIGVGEESEEIITLEESEDNKVDGIID